MVRLFSQKDQKETSFKEWVCARSEPRKFISEARRVLRSGGRVYIADPYFPPVVRQLANLVIPLFRMGDVKIYNKAELLGFLDGRGFKNIEVRRFGKSGYIMTGERE